MNKSRLDRKDECHYYAHAPTTIFILGGKSPEVAR